MSMVEKGKWKIYGEFPLKRENFWRRSKLELSDVYGNSLERGGEESNLSKSKYPYHIQTYNIYGMSGNQWLCSNHCAVSKWLRNSKDGQVYLKHDYASTHSLQLHFSLLPWANLKISSLFTHTHTQPFIPMESFQLSSCSYLGRLFPCCCSFGFFLKLSVHIRPKTKIDIRKLHKSFYSV